MQIQAQESSKPASPLRSYSFELEKADEIFDILYKANQLRIIRRHKFPFKEELKGRDSCKWHSTYTHATKSCVTFRNIVQDKIDRNVLKFPEAPQESMAIDVDLFPIVDVNTTSIDFSLLIPNKNLCVKINKSKVNLLQVLCPQEKQLVQATQGMSNLRIDQSTTSNQNNSAKSYGRSTSIQGNNVHLDKGKSVAYPIEQPTFSYEEILRRESPKCSQEVGEDDTICEKCSHILAKCFTKTKEEDSKRQHEPEIGKPKPRSVSHSH